MEPKASLCVLLFCYGFTASLATQFSGYLTDIKIDQRNGDIYLATRYRDVSYIYKEDGNLENRKRLTIEGYVVSLALDDQQDVLIVCVSNGRCTQHDVWTLKSKGPALQGPYCTNVNTLYDRYDGLCPIGQRVADFLSGESQRVLNMMGDITIDHCESSLGDVDTSTALYTPGPSSNVLGVAFVYGFDYNGYVYSVGSFEKTESAGQTRELRISRVCADDDKQQSYVEVPLRCNCSTVLEGSDKFDSESHDRMNWAQTAKISVALASSLNITEGEDALYYVVASRCLCVVTMSDIERSFVENIESCMAQETDPERETFQCMSNTYNTANEAGCTGLDSTSSSVAIPVVGRALRGLNKKARVASMMSTGGHSILVYGDGQHVTDSYEAVPIVPSTIPVAAGDESDSNCENEIEGEFRLHPDNTHVYTLDRSKRSQKSVVTKRILWECGKLTTCNSCLTSENPLCGWCAQETTCTLETQCKSLVWIQALSETSEGKDDDLEPLCGFQNGVISSANSLKFNPTSTLLTPSLDFCGSIVPDPTGSFASPETPLISVSVFVDDVPCTNVTYPARQCQADDNGFSFSCTLLSQKRPLDGPVYGQFLLGVGPSYTRMRLTSTENFEWRVPTIETFSPRKGPMSGGTLVEILGTDLLFRSDPQIVIGDQPCQTMESSTDTKLQCKTSPVQDANIQSLISINYKGNDLEYIAESRDKYTYTEDPTVSQISPTRVFLGGGFLHDVVGTNLDTVAGPNFVVAMTENNVQTAEWSSPCEVKTPTFMQCPTPKIDLPSNIDVNHDDGQCGLISATTDGKNVQFGYGFIFDGAKEWKPENIAGILDNTFTIARNPVFDNFKGENDILTIEPTDNMTITGKRLDCGPQMKYLQIEVGDGFCDVISINQTVLECQPMSINETLSVHPVQVLIGSSVDIANVYDVGYLKYQEFFTTTEQTTTISSPPTTHRNLSTTNLRTTTRRTTHGGVGRTTTTIPTNKTMYVSSPASEDRQTSRKTVAYAPQTQGIWSTQMISIIAACGAVAVVIIVIIVVACVVVRKKRVNDNGVHNNNLNHGNNIPVKESVTYVPNKEENDNSKVYFLPQTEKQEFKYTDV